MPRRCAITASADPTSPRCTRLASAGRFVFALRLHLGCGRRISDAAQVAGSSPAAPRRVAQQVRAVRSEGSGDGALCLAGRAVRVYLCRGSQAGTVARLRRAATNPGRPRPRVGCPGRAARVRRIARWSKARDPSSTLGRGGRGSASAGPFVFLGPEFVPSLCAPSSHVLRSASHAARCASPTRWVEAHFTQLTEGGERAHYTSHPHPIFGG